MKMKLGMIIGVVGVAFLVLAPFGIAIAQDGEPKATDTPSESQEQPVPSRFGEQPADEAFGAFQRGLYITAKNLAEPRAEKGDAAAQTLLAEIYSRGLGVGRDVEQAAYWYERAADQGVPEAQFQYALYLLDRAPDDNEMKVLATSLMRQAADSGNAQAQFNYAQIILSERPGSAGQTQALGYFKAAAERNIADAQYALAQYYLSGTGNVDIDLTQARAWMAKAASLNFTTAQLELGNMMLSGAGGERNLEQGFAWIMRAARSGNVPAQSTLAKLYWGGIGVEPDSVEAAAWLVLARRAGSKDRVLDDFWEGLSIETQQAAIARANRLL